LTRALVRGGPQASDPDWYHTGTMNSSRRFHGTESFQTGPIFGGPERQYEGITMHALSDTQIRNAKPADKEYTLLDGAGLSVRVLMNRIDACVTNQRAGS